MITDRNKSSSGVDTKSVKGFNQQFVDIGLLYVEEKLTAIQDIFWSALSEGKITRSEYLDHKKKIPEDISLKIKIFERIWDKCSLVSTGKIDSIDKLDEAFNAIKTSIPHIISETLNDNHSKVIIKDRKVELYLFIIDLYHKFAKLNFHLEHLKKNNYRLAKLSDIHASVSDKIPLDRFTDLHLANNTLTELNSELVQLYGNYNNLYKDYEKAVVELDGDISLQERNLQDEKQVLYGRYRDLISKSASLARRRKELVSEQETYQSTLTANSSSDKLQKSLDSLTARIETFNEDLKNHKEAIVTYNANIDTQISRFQTSQIQLNETVKKIHATFEELNATLLPEVKEIQSFKKSIDQADQLIQKATLSIASDRKKFIEERASIPSVDEFKYLKRLLDEMNTWAQSVTDFVSTTGTEIFKNQSNVGKGWLQHIDPIKSNIDNIREYLIIGSPSRPINSGLQRCLQYETSNRGDNAQLTKRESEIVKAEELNLKTQTTYNNTVKNHKEVLSFQNLTTPPSAVAFNLTDFNKIDNFKIEPLTISQKTNKQTEELLKRIKEKEEQERQQAAERINKEEKLKEKRSVAMSLVDVYTNALNADDKFIAQYRQEYPSFNLTVSSEAEKMRAAIKQYVRLVSQNDFANAKKKLAEITELNTEYMSVMKEFREQVANDKNSKPVEMPRELSPPPSPPSPKRNIIVEIEPLLSNEKEKGFWQKYWKRILVGVAVGVLLGVAGVFTAGLVPAIVGGSALAIGLGCAAVAGGVTLGAGVAAASGKVKTKEEGGAWGFIKRNKKWILGAALIAGIIIGGVLTGGILAGVGIAVGVGVGVAASLTTVGVAVSAPVAAGIATGVITAGAVTAGAVAGAGIAAALENKKAGQPSPLINRKPPNQPDDAKPQDGDDYDHSPKQSPKLSPRVRQHNPSSTITIPAANVSANGSSKNLLTQFQNSPSTVSTNNIEHDQSENSQVTEQETLDDLLKDMTEVAKLCDKLASPENDKLPNVTEYSGSKFSPTRQRFGGSSTTANSVAYSPKNGMQK